MLEEIAELDTALITRVSALVVVSRYLESTSFPAESFTVYVTLVSESLLSEA